MDVSGLCDKNVKFSNLFYLMLNNNKIKNFPNKAIFPALQYLYMNNN